LHTLQIFFPSIGCCDISEEGVDRSLAEQEKVSLLRFAGARELPQTIADLVKFLPCNAHALPFSIVCNYHYSLSTSALDSTITIPKTLFPTGLSGRFSLLSCCFNWAQKFNFFRNIRRLHDP
jgi:hypothetical protein